MKLSEAEIGTSLRVLKINTGKKLALRLNSIGIIPGTTITPVKKGVFGSPILIKVRDFYLAIRDDEAKQMEVETVDGI